MAHLSRVQLLGFSLSIWWVDIEPLICKLMLRWLAFHLWWLGSFLWLRLWLASWAHFPPMQIDEVSCLFILVHVNAHNAPVRVHVSFDVTLNWTALNRPWQRALRAHLTRCVVFSLIVLILNLGSLISQKQLASLVSRLYNFRWFQWRIFSEFLQLLLSWKPINKRILSRKRPLMLSIFELHSRFFL